MTNKIKNNHGVTLIEMLIVITIIGVVSTLVGSFFKTSQVVFREGQDQTVEQHAVRLAADIIAKELRNAETIELFSDISLIDYVDYTGAYYLLDNRLVYDDGMGSVVYKTHSDLLTSVEFTLSGLGNTYFLEYTVMGNADGDNFDVTSKVLLNNIDSADMLEIGVDINDINDTNNDGIGVSINDVILGYSKP